MPRDYRTTALDYLRQRYADDPGLAALEERANGLVDHVLAEETSDALAAY